MEAFAPNSIGYHRGAGYYIELIPGAIKKIYLRYRETDESIFLSLYPGDTMNQARALYHRIVPDKIYKLQAQNWLVIQNLHFSHIQKGIYRSESGIDLQTYIEYWRENIDKIRQVDRDVTTRFNRYIDETLSLGLITEHDAKEIDLHFNQSNRHHIRPCPGIYMEYTWPLRLAASADEEGVFRADVKIKIEQVLDSWGQTPPF